MEKIDKTSIETEIINLMKKLNLSREHAEQIVAFECGINASDFIELKAEDIDKDA